MIGLAAFVQALKQCGWVSWCEESCCTCRAARRTVWIFELEAQLVDARALLDRCTMVPYSLLDDIRKWQSANPESPRALTAIERETLECAMLTRDAEREVLDACAENGSIKPWADNVWAAVEKVRRELAELARRAVKP